MQMRPPAPVMLQIFGDMLREQNMSGITALHHAPRHVNAGPSHIRALVYVDNPANWSAMYAHPQPQFWMFFERTTYLQRALNRRFGSRIKDQRHPVAGRN